METHSMKDKKLIPPGCYCYIPLEEDIGCVLCCPYWSINPGHPEQDNGYCAYMEEGDWESPFTGLLWDQVKECGENEDEFKTGPCESKECIKEEQKWLKYMLKQGQVPNNKINLVKAKIAEE